MTLPVILAHALAWIVLMAIAAGLLVILPTAAVYGFATVGIVVALRYAVQIVSRHARCRS